MIVCRCEEVKEEEIVAAIRKGARSIDSIKRRVNAGMGLCQGRTCQRLIAQILARGIGLPMQKILPMTYRPPIRPLPIKASRR